MRKKFFTIIIAFVFLVSCRTEKADFVNSIGMEFNLIPAGEFRMGAQGALKKVDFVEGHRPFLDPYDRELTPMLSKDTDEEPNHIVKISKPFYMGKFEVTQGQYQKVMDTNPSFFKGNNLPVENVSYNDALKFIDKLNSIEGKTIYHLPTEAQWEYAARAGSNDLYFFGDGSDSIREYVWFFSNSNGKTNRVGRLKPNQWGLHDMIGNVWEWCGDYYDHEYYSKSPSLDPKGPETGFVRVFRGSSWFFYNECCRSADRENGPPDFKTYYLGFRLVASVE